MTLEGEKEETRATRFKRVAEKRTKRVLNDIRLIGNCSNKSVYQYSPEDLAKIFGAIEEALKVTKARFTGDQKTEFKL